jgi:hypothetical protein
MPAILNRKAPAPRASILSPKTGKPLVEETFGVLPYLRLLKMLANDDRLSNDMKHEVLIRVLRRKSEIDSGSRTLGDVAAQEANRLVAGH